MHLSKIIYFVHDTGMRCKLLTSLQDWEKKRHLLEAGPSRLLRPHSHHGCPQNRGRSAGKESDTHANISTWTIGECSASELPLVPSQTQLARDSCLSIPKHSPKLCVAIHGGCRLFGQDALLPLQSQVHIVFIVQVQRRLCMAPLRSFQTRNRGARKVT